MEKTTKLVSLFAATVLVAGTLAGCGDSDDVVAQEQAVCYDNDENGYCDDSNDEVDHSHGFIYVGSSKKYYKKGYYPSSDGKVYRSAKPKDNSTSSGSSTGTGTTGGQGTSKNGSSNGTTTKPGTGTGSSTGTTTQPPKSSSGTGTVVSGSSGKSSSNTGISSGSKGGIGSSSSSSSS